MDTSKIKGTITRNKVALGAVGVLAVLGLAWQARSKPGAGADAAQAAQPATSYSAGGQTAGAGGYDSTSSDIYNAIQPQLENLQRLYDQIPVPGPASTAASVGDTRSAIRGAYTAANLPAPPEADIDTWLGRIEDGSLTLPTLQSHLQGVAASR